MTRLLLSLTVAALFLAGCNDATPQMGSDGKPLPVAHIITQAEKSEIPFRMMDSINALRAAKGLQALELSAPLTAAAATHSRDMSVQNRPWHFGSDGSSPIDRVARTGYEGPMLGEAISETFENDVETLAAWIEDRNTREVIMNPAARHLGIAWFQEINGKVWWTLVIGG
ncbi:MAG: CAP domain-containing protein [Paracoccaceae bacterium]